MTDLSDAQRLSLTIDAIDETLKAQPPESPTAAVMNGLEASGYVVVRRESLGDLAALIDQMHAEMQALADLLGVEVP